MARSTKTVPHWSARIQTFPTLALWQLRETWRLLLVTGTGIVAAVVLVCAVPLYSQISMTAELRDFLSAHPANSNLSNAEIAIHSDTEQISPSAVHDVGQQLERVLQNNLGTYLSGPTQFSFQTTGLPTVELLNDKQGHVSPSVNANQQMRLVGASITQAASHLTLVEGRLPQTTSDDLEIALPTETARGLQVVPGSLLTLQMSFVDYIGQRVGSRYLVLHVVGTFNLKQDPYWNGDDLQCEPLGLSGELCNALTSNETLLSVLDRMTIKGVRIESPPNALWYYRMDPSRVDVNNLSNVQTGLSNVLVDIANKPVKPPFVTQTQAFSPVASALETYSSRIAVVQIPVTSLSLLVVSLILFFVSMMTDILVDRQSEGVAIMRSRGASGMQIFGSFVAQSIGLGIIALIVGPLLTIVAVGFVVGLTLPATDQGALNIITTDPRPITQELFLSACAIVAVSIIAMAISISGVIRRGVFSMRREAARSTHRPLWQRLSLDVVAAIIALTAYGFTVYETSPGVLDARVRVLVLPPLTLAGVIFLLLGITLLFLRVFPFLLLLGLRLTSGSRSATPMLALAQMARAPRQSTRMTMLLAFSIAFAIFTLIFNASQSQRILDVANYQVGADFSGIIQGTGSVYKSATYQAIPGVTSATVGYTSFPRASLNGLDLSVQFLAVDADTFAKTAIWSEQDVGESGSIDSLMKLLVGQRAGAAKNGLVPAIVDATAWDTLHLSMGSTFTLTDVNGTVSFITIGRVKRIPTVNDSTEASGTGNYFLYGGILADYQSYSAVSLKVNNIVPATTTVWLRTRDDAPALSSVRAALGANGRFPLDRLNDRRAIINNLRNDPLYIDLVGVLILGTATALLLALVGNLIASWLSIRSRLTNFAVLRALGTAPRQITGIIAIEQGIVYATALVLGVAFGALLSVMALPALVFTNVAISGLQSDITSGEFYILQNSPPIQVIIPNSLGLVFGVLVILCVIALGMMVRIAARPSVSQTLRLNED